MSKISPTLLHVQACGRGYQEESPAQMDDGGVGDLKLSLHERSLAGIKNDWRDCYLPEPPSWKRGLVPDNCVNLPSCCWDRLLQVGPSLRGVIAK